MEFRSDAMLCSNLCNENSDTDHIKFSRGPQVPPHPFFEICSPRENTDLQIEKRFKLGAKCRISQELHFHCAWHGSFVPSFNVISFFFEISFI